ncbi:cytochrome P450, partial [Schizopora paradoxa]
YQPSQEHEVQKLLGDLNREPGEFRRHIRRFIASVMLTAAYGYRVTSVDDPFIEMIERTNKLILGPGLPGTTVVDHFPFLQHIPTWLPGGHIRRHANLAHQTAEEILNRPFKFVLEHRAAGDAIPSFASTLLSQYEQSEGNDPAQLKRIIDVAGSLYRAGTDSTFTVILTFMLAMTLNPSAMKKAQAELDAVVGRDKLPTMADRSSLPYVECILKETLRWHPPFPMGISHRSLDEDELEGMRIPKGSIIMPNIWGMMHDEDHFPDNQTFKPERFGKGEGRIPELDPTLAIFGFGRRICPGRHFADATVWLTIASILHAFDILPESKTEEKPVYAASRFYTGAISIPKPFKCRILPRINTSSMPSFEV